MYLASLILIFLKNLIFFAQGVRSFNLLVIGKRNASHSNQLQADISYCRVNSFVENERKKNLLTNTKNTNKLCLLSTEQNSL